jgi:predicted nucleic acid-binding protein
MTKLVNYAWDTSVFLAWLAEETAAPLDDIAAVVEQIDKREANLIVSVTVYSEVLEAKHSAEQMEAFKKFLKRSNVIVVDTTLAVAEKAMQIRSKGLNQPGKRRKKTQARKIGTPDATHLATAILWKADVLHSLDKKLLQLSGDPIVDGLLIKEPMRFDGQKLLF